LKNRANQDIAISEIPLNPFFSMEQSRHWLDLPLEREAPPSRATLFTPNEALRLWRRTVERDFMKLLHGAKVLQLIKLFSLYNESFSKPRF
jgi:hypothetical protein